MVGDVLVKNPAHLRPAVLPSARPRGGPRARSRPTPPSRVRIRQADSRISGRSSAAVITASTSSIRRPGRTTDVLTRTGPTGTGAKMS